MKQLPPIAEAVTGSLTGAVTGGLTGAGGSGAVTPLNTFDYTTGQLGANVTHTRASNATITDHEGVIRTIPNNCAAFGGLRFVRNLFTDTTTTLATSAATTAVSVGVGTYIFSMGAGSGTATFSGTATGSSGTLDADGSSRTAKTLTITVAGTIIVTASVADLATIQLEDSTGRTDTDTPSEYISAGVESAPYHGAGADGCKYFATENGNGVLSNVVTEGTGAAITGGYFDYQPAATNLIIESYDFSTSWSLNNGALSSDAEIAPDGSLATILVDDASTGSGDVRVSLGGTTAPSTEYCFSQFAKQKDLHWIYLRINGMASQDLDCYFDIDNGAYGSSPGNDVSSQGIDDIGDGWFRCWFVFTSDASDTVASYRVYAADDDNDFVVDLDGTSSIYIWGAQLEEGDAPTAYIPTYGTTASRAAISLSYSGIAADNETRAVVDAADVDVDDWDGVVDATIVGAEEQGEISSITVYTTGERPA